MPYVNQVQKDNVTYEITPSSTAPQYSASSTYAVGDFCYYDGTLYRCKTAITTGEAWTAAHWEATTVGDSLNDDVSNLKEDLSQLSQTVDGKVDDVKVNNVSVVTDGVAEIPIATNSKNLGVMKVGNNWQTGVGATSSGELYVQKADTGQIRSGTNQYVPVVPYNQHEATFWGLATASGDTTQSASSNPVGTYTDEAKVAIQKMLGIYEAPWELIREDTFTLPTQGNIEISVDDNGQPLELTDMYCEFVLPVQETEASVASYGRVRFYTGNTNVLTLYMSEWTQAAGTAAKSASQLIEQKNGNVEISYTRNTLTNGEPTIYTLGINPQNGSQSRMLFRATKYIFTKIVFEAITGTAKVYVHGRRKWS